MINALSGESEPQYVTDAAGNRVAVLLDLEQYQELLDAVDELDAIRAYDAAKSEDDEAIPLDEALRDIGRDRQAP